jgi:GAF domain-containing protein
MADEPQRESTNAAEARLNRLLNLILESAVEALGFDAATVTARQGGVLATIGATDQRLVALDDAQYEAGDGPCVDVLEPRDPIYVEDAAADRRWEQFRQTAAHLGVRTTLSVHVPTDPEEIAASLNFYAKRQLALSDDQLAHAITYAEQLAATILSVDAYRAAIRLAQGMAEAMRSRAQIEQAKGMLMADHGLNADEAFEQLARLSQHANIKVRDVARRLVEERSKRR